MRGDRHRRRMTSIPSTRPCVSRPTRAHVSALSGALDREWQHLRRRPEALAAATGWAILPVPLSDLQDLLVAVGYRTTGGAGPDRVVQNERLHRLLHRARSDDLAARIVLQRLVPGLVVDLARRGDHDRRATGRFDELIGSAWISVRIAHVAAGSPCVAGRLMDDAWYRAFKAPRRRRSAQELVVDPGKFQDLPAATDRSPFEELAAIVGEARRRGLDPDDVGLIQALVRSETAASLAAERCVTPRTVRNHRDRVVYSLRRLAAA